MVRASSKKKLLTVLVAAYAIQTTLVFTDDPTGELSQSALRGREIWHDDACQVCHQIYGQGGPLGPDLTNAASRVDDTRLRSLLTVGSGQMPALGYSDEQIADVRAYLEALDRPDLGRGQLRLGSTLGSTGPWGPFAGVVKRALEDGPGDARAGFGSIEARPCVACHYPLRESPVGAPDLSTVAGRLSTEELKRVLREGRIERGMPPPAPAFSPEDLDGVVAFLTWFGENRDRLEERASEASAGRSVDWARLPWWEFR
jgi:nitric oxide reductase subunit C